MYIYIYIYTIPNNNDNNTNHNHNHNTNTNNDTHKLMCNTDSHVSCFALPRTYTTEIYTPPPINVYSV